MKNLPVILFHTKRLIYDCVTVEILCNLQTPLESTSLRVPVQNLSSVDVSSSQGFRMSSRGVWLSTRIQSFTYTPMVSSVSLLRGFRTSIVKGHECVPVSVTDKGGRSVLQSSKYHVTQFLCLPVRSYPSLLTRGVPPRDKSTLFSIFIWVGF